MTKFVNETNNINWKELSELRKFLNTPISNRQEYVEWVWAWKVLHKELVASIQGLRAKKNAATSGYDKNALQSLKIYLRPYAREMYEMRAENKQRLKEGAFPERVLEDA